MQLGWSGSVGRQTGESTTTQRSRDEIEKRAFGMSAQTSDGTFEGDTDTQVGSGQPVWVACNLRSVDNPPGGQHERCSLGASPDALPHLEGTEEEQYEAGFVALDLGGLQDLHQVAFEILIFTRSGEQLEPKGEGERPALGAPTEETAFAPELIEARGACAGNQWCYIEVAPGWRRKWLIAAMMRKEERRSVVSVTRLGFPSRGKDKPTGG